jgi:hypothetical protein
MITFKLNENTYLLLATLTTEWSFLDKVHHHPHVCLLVQVLNFDEMSRESSRQSINSFININHTSPCATLKVQEIRKASKSIISKSAYESGSLLLNLVFTTVPGKAMFESRVYRRSYQDQWIMKTLFI